MEKEFVVYKHTTPSNKVYIGITSQSCQKRWIHGDGYTGNTYFYRAIQHYGWENIKHEILFEHLSEKEAKNIEMRLIKEYNSTSNQYGYNKTEGGDCRASLSEHGRYLVSIKNKGKIRTPEQREHYREAALKRPKRLTLSDEHKRSISKSLLGNQRAKGVKTNQKPIIQLTKDYIPICFYECAKEVGYVFHCGSSGINSACRGNRQTNIHQTKYKGIYKGFRWMYIEDYMQNQS